MRKMLLATAALVAIGGASSATAEETKCVDADGTKWCMGMVSSIHPQVPQSLARQAPDFYHRFQGPASESVSTTDHIDTGLFGDNDVYAPALIRRTGWLNTNKTGVHKIRLRFEGPKLPNDLRKELTKSEDVDLSNFQRCHASIKYNGRELNGGSFGLGTQSTDAGQKAVEAKFRTSNASPKPLEVTYSCKLWTSTSFQKRLADMRDDNWWGTSTHLTSDPYGQRPHDSEISHQWLEVAAYQLASEQRDAVVETDVSLEIATGDGEYRAPSPGEIIFKGEKYGQLASSGSSVITQTFDGEKKNFKKTVVPGLKVSAHTLSSDKLKQDDLAWDATEWHPNYLSGPRELFDVEDGYPPVFLDGEQRNGWDFEHKRRKAFFDSGNLMESIDVSGKPDATWSVPSGVFSTTQIASRAGVRHGGKLVADGYFIADATGRHTFAVVVDGNPGKNPTNGRYDLNACSISMSLDGNTILSGEEMLREGGGYVVTGGADLAEGRVYKADVEMACRWHGKDAYGPEMAYRNGVKWTLMLREPDETTLRRVDDGFVHKVEGDSNNASNFEGADGAVSFD
ncbi:hypothetical protein CKO28_24085 [Rhodovibrio sodomensis]|uniref:Uncharacterized protein n=1 Tax=Rhodovibrio sodomensis TaxID=1088 RepID=A0ABS1DM55_9PROT|nr:hypothetical protein [Rhodovibrio sodomensis]MBK1671091.1 hypothetical protein [Rhodovibrio sodomensis]